MRALSAIVFIGLLAAGGCAGRVSNALPAAGSLPASHIAGGDTVLHSFGHGSDGANPVGQLVLLNGLWYGVTQYGGKYRNGTAFTIDANGREKIVHSFGAGTDASQPFAGFIVVKGTLYGTSQIGGTYGYGTVFSMTPAGNVHVLHSFGGSPDGRGPQAALAYANGTLYGTTYYGGNDAQCGIVFGVTLAGKETIVHTFTGGSDGATPDASPIYANGVLYGTTLGGGNPGQGTLYSIASNGKLTTLHNFGGASDDAPTGIVMIGGAIYGTTAGTEASDPGTVYSLTTGGKYKTLYTFLQNGGFDGYRPYGSLVAVGNEIYGTTGYGGSGISAGTVFKISTAGKEAVVYAFKGAPDGELPNPGGVTYSHGRLYGMTYNGGKYPTMNTLGGGTAYSVALR